MAHYESVLCVIKECCVYKIPPRANVRGYKAMDWDVEQFMWKGRLRIIGIGDECVIQLEDGVTGELFAKCPYDLEGTAVEPTLDSSRYFVIKIVDPASGQHAFVGIGFQERSWAFDFNVALQDHVKRVRASKQSDAGQTSVSTGPKIDYSLKEGQRIQINLGASKKPAQDKQPVRSGGGDDFNQFSIMPPPSHSAFPMPAVDAASSSGSFFPAMEAFPPPPKTKSSVAGSGGAAHTGGFMDDFGDFAGASAGSTSSNSNSGGAKGNANSNSASSSNFSGWTTF